MIWCYTLILDIETLQFSAFEFNMHRNHLEDLVTVQFRIRQVWDAAWGFLLLTSFQMIMNLLNYRPHLEEQCWDVTRGCIAPELKVTINIQYCVSHCPRTALSLPSVHIELLIFVAYLKLIMSWPDYQMLWSTFRFLKIFIIHKEHEVYFRKV